MQTLSDEAPENIRTNLTTSLFGTTGEQSTHIVEVRELMGDITEPMMSVPSEKQFFFRVFGKNALTAIRVLGVFQEQNFYLGERDVHTAANIPE